MKPVYLFTVPWMMTEDGGVVEVVRNLYRVFAAENEFTPAVLVNSWDEKASNAPWWTIPSRLLSPVENCLKGRLAFWVHLPVQLFRLRYLTRKVGVAVINPHFPGLYCIHFLLLRRLGLFSGRLVLSFHGSDIRTAVRTRGFERRLWMALIDGADANVCCSQSLADEVVHFVPSARQRTFVVHNGIDSTVFSSEASATVDELRHLPPTPFLLNIGAFEHQKGLDILVHAFDRVRDRYPELALVIVGGRGPSLHALKELVKNKNLDERVSILESLPHRLIPEVMRRAKLFVLPSRAEGFPIVLFESGVFAKPVLATRVGGALELIEDGVDGRLVPCENVDALVSAMTEMLEDPEGSRRMGERLRMKIIERFTWRRAALEYARVTSQMHRSQV